ncbi:MAG: glycosyltransferase family 2 protein, partial [Terriglobia bacterium]
SKTFAITEGLLPPDQKMDNAFRLFNLEVWLLVGLALVGMGFGGALHGVNVWQRQGFGALVPTHVMRIAIPSGLSLAVGCQIILSGFFLSLLRLGRK